MDGGSLVLFVDNRIGSNDLYAPLVKTGIPTEMLRLQFADFAFVGRGNDDHPLNIGIERKRLSDLVDSLRSGRLSGHQLPGLLGPNGAYDLVWLVVEGIWRVGRTGLVVVPVKRRSKVEWVPLPGNMPASELVKHVLTLELCGGVHVRYTNSPEDTVHFLVHLYHWFCDKTMDRHTTHLAPQRAAGIIPLSPFRRAVTQWPEIGVRTSAAVETHFGGSLRRAANAGINEWAGIAVLDRAGKPRRLGVSHATNIVTFCTGVRHE